MLGRPSKLAGRVGFIATVLMALAIGLGFYMSSQARAGTRASSSSNVTVRTAKVTKLGTILVDKAGHALYVFAPDKAKKVTCNSACQSYWPGLAAPAHGSAKAAGSAKQSLIGSDPNSGGKGRVVTYAGWPLYTYLGDSAAGEASGQGKDESGGHWHVMRPNGKPLT